MFVEIVEGSMKMKPKMISLLKAVPVYKFGEKYETSVDGIYIFEVNKNISSDKFDVFEYSGKPKPKPSLIDNSHKIYQRDKKVAENALIHANCNCEINTEHPSFIRKTNGSKYSEPHHLVPMAMQDRFDVSLDVEENVVSLCSNCHNEIHYGKYADRLIKILYNQRKELLKNVGIDILLEELINMY